MSSWRNHRVIIASLFLPTTAVLGEPTSSPTSPSERARTLAPVPLSPQPSGLVEKPINAPRPQMPGAPLKSIVDDLKDKSRAVTPTATPGSENVNPFTRFAEFSGISRPPSSTPGVGPSPPLIPGVSAAQSIFAQMNRPGPRRTITDHHIPHRIYRKNSRASSSSRSRQASIDKERARSNSSSLHLETQAYHVEFNPHCNGGLRNAVNSVEPRMKKRPLWVGVLGTQTDGWNETLRKSVERREREEGGGVVVWIPDKEFEGCYDEFCHQVLWPALHYAVPDAPKTKMFYESAAYKQYVAVNERFADAIVANYQEGDIIWVNDYHLMLLPALLRARLPAAPVGFFMHVAFPSSEIFRCLSVREHLLRGVLAADLIGFQTANYARHFRHSVSRILALEALPKGIQVEERFVDVGVFAMGIDVQLLKERRREPEVQAWVDTLRQRYAGMKLIVGRDKLDEVQGVRHKLQAFETFLEKHPEWRGQVVLIQVALQTTEENELQGGVSDIVARINSRYSTLTYQPVIFLHTEDLSFSQYLALLTVADAFIVTSLREGMALRTHEFVECQKERCRPLILSEFTGSYSYSGFRSCIPINPYDTRGTANAIHQALTMTEEEASSRWQDLHNHVVAQTAQTFVSTFLARCLRAYMEHLQGEGKDVAPLDLGHLLPSYKHSQKRMFLIDFEDTLWKRDPVAKVFDPPEDAFELLKKLAEDEKNEVWLLSGLPIKGALEKVAERVPKIGLVAENGCFIKTLPDKNGKSEWVNMVANFNFTWKPLCLELLNYFTERTPGSFVEEREASMVWRFWPGSSDDNSGDRAWALRQAAEAQNHIFDSLGERYGLRIIPGANSFLVLPNNISRSTAVGAISHPGGPAHSPLAGRAAWMAPETDPAGSLDKDFLLAVGSDEKLLRRLNELDAADTCSTGDKGTDAKWRLDPRRVREVLWQFAKAP